jgi:hypothetical protein
VSIKANLPWCKMEVWYDPKAITNVLSFTEVQAMFPITYKNEEVDEFTVKTNKGMIKFSQISKNLYAYKPIVKIPNQEMNMLNTVKENKMHFTNCQFARAQAARNLLRALGCPSDGDLKAILRLNLIKDFPVVLTNLDLEENTFGKDVPIIKGKSVRSKPKQEFHNTIEVPRVLKECRVKSHCALPPFLSTRWHSFTQFRKKSTNREVDTYKKCLIVMCNLYKKAGFQARYVSANNEFSPVLAKMADEYGFKPNISTALEHIPVVECSIRVVTESCRATIHGSPHKALPRVLIKCVV